MSQFDKKYKERSPKETIRILQDFFQSRGITVHLVDSVKTEAGTWCCHLELLFRGRKLQHANGKGMTEDYSLASGYAEAYERFCNMFPILCNIHFMDKYMELSQKRNGYRLHPGEKELDFHEIQKEPLMQLFYKQGFHSRTDIIDPITAVQTGGSPLGTPFVNIMDASDVRYFDHRLYNRVTGSKGFAAGNTTIEALNQGLSELFEGYGVDQFYAEIQPQYYELNIKKIKNKSLTSKISAIQKLGYEVHFLDLSYNFHYPVILGIIIDTAEHSIYLDFGAFPIFEIALERTITELYQGIPSYKRIRKFTGPARGERLITPNSPLDYILDERVLDRTVMVDECCDKYYLNNINASNDEIFEYCCQLLKRDGKHVYYEDNSLIPEMKAIALYSPDFITSRLKMRNMTNTSDDILSIAAVFVLKMYQLTTDILSASSPDAVSSKTINELSGLMELIPQKEYGQIAGQMTFYEWLELYGVSGSPVLEIVPFYSHLFDAVSFINRESLYYPYIRKYTLIQSYAVNPNYNKEEKIHYIQKLGVSDVTEEDLDCCFDREFILRRILIEPYYNFYHSKEYEDLIATYLH